MSEKQYRWASVDIAMQLLRPGAHYQLRGTCFEQWHDPRPCPTWDEVEDAMQKLRNLEDGIKTLYIEDYQP